MRTLTEILADCYKFHPSMIDPIKALVTEAYGAGQPDTLFIVWYCFSHEGEWLEDMVGIARSLPRAKELAQDDFNETEDGELKWDNQDGTDFAALEDGNEYYVTYTEMFYGDG